MVRGIAGRGQTGAPVFVVWRTAEVTLLLSDLRITHVGKEAGMGGTASGIEVACFGETQCAVHGVPHIGGVGIFLAIVFPPANGAQGHGFGHVECFEAAARAAITNFNGLHD